jgi:hypothetical protein
LNSIANGKSQIANLSADIAIIGGGAAGLAAAIFAAQAAGAGRRIVLLDGAKTLGAKILVSGGGRCNVTHDVVTQADFNGQRNIVRNILAAFDAPAAVRWFSSMGVELKREETGKLFPVTDSARTVLNALLSRCRELGVIIECGSRVQRMAAPTPEKQSFVVEHSAGTISCRRLIVSTGGRSLPRSGSDGSGWDMIAQLGHTVTPTYPALVPLVLDPQMFHAQLSGISHDVELSTFGSGKRIDARAGSLLWTHFGISGPVVMDASRHWIIAQEMGLKPELICNALHPDGFETGEKWLINQTTLRPRASILNVLAQRVPERVAAAFITHAGVDPTMPGGQLSRDARRALTHTMTALPLRVSQPRGWNYAEVTAGGVPLNEIDYRTMESRKIPGLYLAGEILDCDGRIGGFNFQWAWATGYLAGNAAGRL